MTSSPRRAPTQGEVRAWMKRHACYPLGGVDPAVAQADADGMTHAENLDFKHSPKRRKQT